MPSNICPICLRTDRNLKAIATVLSVYHDELTDYSLEISNPRYCSDCEYLLRKTYNFHQKCSSAAKILKKWAKKISPNRLHLKLPPISLDTWTPENNTVFTYTFSDNLETPVLTEENMSDKPDTSILKETNVSNKLEMDVIKEEIIENTIHSENLFKIEMHCEDYQITGVSETLFKNSNTESEDTTNVFQNKLVNDNTIANAKMSRKSNIIRNKSKRLKNITIDVIKENITTKSNKDSIESNVKKSYFELVLDDDVTNDGSSKNDVINDILKPTHDVPKPTDDTPKVTHIIPEAAHDVSKLVNEMPVTIDHKSVSTCNVTNPINNKPKSTDTNNKTFFAEKPDDIEVICFGDSKNDDVIVIDDEREHQDDESLNSNDDCDDYLYTPPKKRKTKMTLDQLADIILSDGDFDENYAAEKETKTKKSVKKDYSIDKVISTEKSITSKLETISEALDSISESWEITSLIDVGIPNLPNDEVKKFTRQFFKEKKLTDKMSSANLKYLKKRGVEAKLAHMGAELDSIQEKCVKLMEDYKNGLNDPKERLKAELIQKFDLWGELRADDGFVFDKDIIISCLDMVNERLIRQLINFLHGATSLSPGAAVILKRIQNKQHETQYESVFDIEYLTTEKEMLEEFERRKTYECYVEAKFKCEICYQGFKHERQLDYHKKCHDESPGSIPCTICRARHHSRRRLKRHMSAHVAVYKCKLCPLITYYRLSMINHYEQHKGTLYKCEQCGGTYKSKSAYLSHQTHTHPSGAHVCTSCGRAFISLLGLRNHATKKHRGEAPAPGAGGVRCAPCGLSFPTPEAHARHERTLHGAPPAYKKKRAPTFLKPRKKPIMTCRVCNVVGHSYGWLTLHFSTEHPAVDLAAAYADTRTHLCDVCGKGFSNKYTLREHSGLHSGVSHPCAACHKRFQSSAALRRHTLTHAPPAFCCERCGKKFHSYPNLYNHMRTHIGDRRFKCNICSKGFLHRCSLKEHIRGVHNHERRVRKRGVAETQVVSETGLLGVEGVKRGLGTAGEMALSE